MNDTGLSFWPMLLGATPAVQAVVLTLGLASVLCWSVILEKLWVLGRLRRQASRLERGDDQGSGLAAQWHATARTQASCRHPGEALSERRDRIERHLRESFADALMQAEHRLAYLATIGSAAPFIGLFGTVWGIMHAFTAISASQDTSLVAVAPGIAEALAATAIGLVTAIPAAIAYNQLAGAFSLLSRRLQLSASRLSGRLAVDAGAQ